MFKKRTLLGQQHLHCPPVLQNRSVVHLRSQLHCLQAQTLHAALYLAATATPRTPPLVAASAAVFPGHHCLHHGLNQEFKARVHLRTAFSPEPDPKPLEKAYRELCCRIGGALSNREGEQYEIEQQCCADSFVMLSARVRTYLAFIIRIMGRCPIFAPARCVNALS
jgi:hypothetical protein